MESVVSCATARSLSAAAVGDRPRFRHGCERSCASVHATLRTRPDPGYTARHIAVRIESGGGNGPLKPRQPPREGKGANSIRQQQAWEMWMSGFLNLCHRPRRRFFHMPPESLTCKECKSTYPLDASYVCERCFGPLEVTYASWGEVEASELRRRIQAGPHSIWRYRDFLPLEGPPPRDTLPAGWTPLLRADRLAERLGLREVWIKNDAANPTHSFKDRVVAVALARAKELGFRTIACASTGNLANAVAAHAAAAGLDSYVFIPADLEEQKVLATGVYGTNVVKVQGTYDDVNRLCTELSSEREWAFVNVNMRPYYSEGSKTLAYEVAEQLGFELPDRIVGPIASGSLFTRVARGFEEWLEVGLIEGELPKFSGAQAL